MTALRYFAPCPRGLEQALADELTGSGATIEAAVGGGVAFGGDHATGYLANLHSRFASRVLLRVAEGRYRDDDDLYRLANRCEWEHWFDVRRTLRVDVSATRSPLRSLNFATLRIKDAIADRFRAKAGGVRPSIETQWPDVRVFAHLTTDTCTLYIDTSGEPLFKRGWRQDTGDAPLKETLAAAMLAASGWWNPETGAVSDAPLYDPCCGSGTIAIEAAQIGLGIPAGALRRFGFEKLLPFQPHVWESIQNEAADAPARTAPPIFGSDVSHRMVDFAERNAERAGVAAAIEFRGGDALQRMPPEGAAHGGVIVLNPPYGERIEVGGVARIGAREQAATEDGGEFFSQLASHWKKNYAGWTAWMLTPDLQLPKRMRLKESRRVPMWNGPIECRLFRFDMVAGSARTPRS